jgi:hypothetical protein
MVIQILMLILIIALLGYIVFLHFQLAKRNIFIETTVRRLSGIEKTRSMEEMISFLQEIQKLKQFSSFFNDKLLDDSTISFLLENNKDLRIYMHYTKEEADAASILKDGFKFAGSFYKTALQVSEDKLDLVIKHNSRKFFGDYLIIISISNDIVNYYSMELEKAGSKNYSFENILTDVPPTLNDNTELVYQLPSKYIKGYVNHRTGEIVKNPGFDPYYNSPEFIKNIDLLKNK